MVDLQFYYLDPATASGMGVDAGWYPMEDYTFEYCQNDREIPQGQGFCLDCQDSGSSLTYAGQVRVGAYPIDLRDNFNFTGNICPIKKTLGDFVPDFGYGSSTIQILTDEGACETEEIGDLGEVDLQFYYLDPATASGMGVDAGWYPMEDYTFENCQNDREILPGVSFCLDCQDSGSTLELPSAL